VNILKITKSTDDKVNLTLYDDKLNLLESQSFEDVYTLNFYLQTLPRKYNIKKGLLIVHNKNENSVDMIMAEDENSFFIG
jgi:hypothetical protein